MKKPIYLALLLATVMSPPAFAAEVRIKRDNYGMPHIYADNVYDLFYGYGYAIAEDRLFQMEMSKRTTQGTVSEVLGEDYVKFDTGIRKNYYFEPIKAQLAALPPSDKAIFDGYAAGINAYIDVVNKNKDKLLSKQFIDFGFEPSTWSGYDIAMIFVGSMVNRFGDFNTELTNAKFMAGLQKANAQTAQQVFDYLMPYISDKGINTVSVDEWSADGRKAYRETLLEGAKKVADSTGNTKHTESTIKPTYAELTAMLTMPQAERAYSNIFILSKSKSQGANSVLINGPQFGHFQPAYTYSVGLHGAGYETVGNSPFGYPLIQFGHNADIAWGSTWGAADNVDIFTLQLDETGKKYLQNGKYVDLDVRDEVIKIKGKPDKVVPAYRSVYGSVVGFSPDNKTAYAKARAWEGEEIATLVAWNKLTQAKNHQQWVAQVAKSAINVNLYYSDKAGNIGYALGGRYPVRHAEYDGRLPTPGDGQHDWLGFYPFDTNPQVYNPKSGYIMNWNNRPAEGFPNPDEFWYSWEAADRAQVLVKLLEAKKRFSADEAWALMAKSAQIDPNAAFFVPQLIAAAQKDEHLKTVAEALVTWQNMDYYNDDADKDGRYDQPATVILRTWIKNALLATLGDEAHFPKAVGKAFLGTGYPKPGKTLVNSHNIQVGVKVLHKWLTAEQPDANIFPGVKRDGFYHAILLKTVAELKETLGNEVSQWQIALNTTAFMTKNFQKIPQANADEGYASPIAMNRGTENNMVVFNEKGVIGKEVAPLGQSGFIAPDGSKSRHYDDQKALYNDYQLKAIYLNADDVDKHTQSTTVLQTIKK